MDRYFTAIADKDYQGWCKTDKKLFKRVNDLIDDIEKNGFLFGIGKPEQLKHYKEPTFSRRIDKSNRLVYCKYNDSDLLMLSCKGHYED